MTRKPATNTDIDQELKALIDAARGVGPACLPANLPVPPTAPVMPVWPWEVQQVPTYTSDRVVPANR